MLYLLPALILLLPQQAAPIPEVDPAIRAVVERFFETQQTEDVDAYLALWSAKANRPQPQQLRYIFDSGDDTFVDVEITRATITGDTARLHVRATRQRTDPRFKRPDGTPRTLNTRLQLALALTREADGWKIVREGSPADELAAALIETNDPAGRKAILDSEPDLLNVRLVEAIVRRADALAQMTRYKEAQAIYERGLDVAIAIGDRKAEGQALQNIANALYYQRDFAGALKLYERRLAIDREIRNDEGIAHALLGMGTVQYSTYDYGAALKSYREALAIQERLGDEVLVSTTLISTGNVLYLQGDYDGAIADYRRAETLKRKYFDLTGAATALEGLGRVYSSQGDYAAALTAFNGVLDERRKRNDISRQALVLQSIGDIHFRLGNTDQARASFDESRTKFETAKDIGSAGRVLQSTALNELVAGRIPAGEKAYTDSIALCTTAKDPECIARAQVGLAYALAAQQKYEDAITWYVRSLVSFNELKLEEAAARARIGLAEALSGKKEYARAFEEAVTARRMGVALASDDILWRALVSQARAERKLGKPAEAIGTARAALLAVQRMAAAALDRPNHAVPRDTTAAYATLAVLQAESNDAAGAFATAEQMRAHALRISLATNERDIARGMTEQERAEELKLAGELLVVIVKRDRQKELPKPDAAQIEKLDAAITELTARRTAWRQKLFERLPDLQTWRGLGKPATSDDLAILLDTPDKRLLQFIVDEHDVLVILAAGAADHVEIAAHVVSIERRELAERIARALDGKSLASVETWGKSSAELFSLLPAAVVERLTSATSITVVPDDLLWRVPFEAMPVETGYLADRANVTYAASVGTAVRVPSAPAADPTAPVVVVHSPQLPKQLLDTLTTTAPTWTIRPPEAAAPEIERIAKASAEPAPVVLDGADATLDRLKSAVPASTTEDEKVLLGPLHLAAPFRINSASPLFSPVLLAAAPPVIKEGEPAKGESAPAAADSDFEVRQLFNMDPLASVVLFSDPAALSKRDAAAAAGTVGWAWRSSGASTVVFRRWGGDDPTAIEVMGRFYEQLRTGRSPAEALHTARAAVRAMESGRAPAAWAGWLIFTSR